MMAAPPIDHPCLSCGLTRIPLDRDLCRFCAQKRQDEIAAKAAKKKESA